MSNSTTVALPEAPNVVSKRGSQFLTLEYVLASVSVVLSVAFSIAAIEALFSLWTGGVVGVGGPLSWIVAVPSGYIGALWTAIAAVLLAVGAWVLYGRVSRAIVTRPTYTDRTSYKLITYATFAALLVQFGIAAITLVTVLLGSLLLIGSESSIGQLYLNIFLPSLLGASIVAVIGFFTYKIVRGINRSKLLSVTLLSISVAILLAVIVTVAVRSHDAYNSNDYGRVESTEPDSIRSFSDFLQNY